MAGPPATLCTDRTSIIVDEGAIDLCPQGEEVYTAAEALHPGQDITCVKLLEHSTALKRYIGMPVADLAGYLLDSMSTEPSCNVCYTPDSQHVNRFLAVPRHVCCMLCAACRQHADDLVYRVSIDSWWQASLILGDHVILAHSLECVSLGASCGKKAPLQPSIRTCTCRTVLSGQNPFLFFPDTGTCSCFGWTRMVTCVVITTV